MEALWTEAEETPAGTEADAPHVQRLMQHVVEIVSDSGEGAQTAGQMFGTLSAKMGNGVWTVEIIPAEIEPPARSRAGASGIRIRLGHGDVSNAGDTADVVVGFNEQVLYSRIDQGAFRPGTLIFLDNKWASDPQAEIQEAYATALADFRQRGYVVREIPIDAECLKHVSDARKGKNMWVVGFLCALYSRDLELPKKEIARRFGKKGAKIVESNYRLLESGFGWAQTNLDYHFDVPPQPETHEKVVMNGNQAIAMGCMAAGMEVCAMYPITPATSASHFLAGTMQEIGGFLHQAEDEIAAIGFAIGASYAGKTAVTITSGPGFALKTEFLGLAVMAEIPLVVVVVQRGGPSTGLPTKVEQGDLLASMFASPGDAPKIILAPATIEECFHFMVTARKLAETFRGPVIVLSDANLATGVQPFPKPEVTESWMAPPIDQSPWDTTTKPYDWDPQTGLSARPIPGQRGGNYVLTGLAHDEDSKVAYESATNQRTMAARSRKLAALQRTLKPARVVGDPEGDLLAVTWGSTLGAIDEAVMRLRREGEKVSYVHLRFLSPLEPGLKEIFQRFRKVMTVEINYGDDPQDPTLRCDAPRFAQLAWMLRAQTLCDLTSWSRVPGGPLQPGQIEEALRQQLTALKG
ncbi:MAG: 2-oxoacid:acceptor oxidoreductase subunit alpha [Candidatus Schekmanbacteria bacterium]|nr:2-oxoacid:acceptor oxidoreductase subunit alpha [Candidatus Schekmanbacteria bacterium]